MIANDRLLYFITARGSITPKDFRFAFNELIQMASCRDRDINLEFERWKTLRILVALGFCDQFASGKIAVAPPVLYPPPDVMDTFILTGARAPGTLATIESEIAGTKITTERIQNQDCLLLPETIVLHGCVEEIEVAAARLHLRVAEMPPAWSLSFAGPSIQTVWKEAPVEELQILNWKHRIFDVATRCFSSKLPLDDTKNRLVEYFDPYEYDWKCFLTLDGETRLVDKDWARYIFMARSGKRALYYEDVSLYVPTTCPLPWWFERSLALCSGFEPKQSIATTGRFTVFSNVPDSIRELVEKKLGQDFVIAQSEEGEFNQC